MSNHFYRDILYPLQDKVVREIADLVLAAKGELDKILKG